MRNPEQGDPGKSNSPLDNYEELYNVDLTAATSAGSDTFFDVGPGTYQVAAAGLRTCAALLSQETPVANKPTALSAARGD